jgi:iron complex transport system substrate-binding protein
MTRLDLAALLSVLGALVFLSVTTVAALRLDPHELAVAAPPRDPGAGFPRDVELPDGTRFHVAQQPVRIIAASARLIDFCAALVPPERIAGYPEQAIEYTTLGPLQAEFASRPRFRDYLAEPVMALVPDLVLADPWQSADTRARLSDAGIPVCVVPEANTWREMCEMLGIVGRLLGEEEAAAREIAELEARVAALRARRRASGALRAVCYSSFGTQGFSAGKGTTIDEAMQLAGITNAFSEAGMRGHQTITFEALLEIDPDAFVVAQPLNAPAGPAGDRGGAAEQLLRNEPTLAELRAVRGGRFLRLPAGLYASASQGIVRAAEVLADERMRVLAEMAHEEGR